MENKTMRYAIFGYAPETPLTDVLGEDLLCEADTIEVAQAKAQRATEIGCKKVRIFDADSGASIQELFAGAVKL